MSNAALNLRIATLRTAERFDLPAEDVPAWLTDGIKAIRSMSRFSRDLNTVKICDSWLIDKEESALATIAMVMREEMMK